MAELVYLKNALGNSQAWTVENGVKLSDGAGVWVPFPLSAGGSSKVAVANGDIINNDPNKTAAEQSARANQTSVSVTIPAGATVLQVRAIGSRSLGSVGDGTFFVRAKCYSRVNDINNGVLVVMATVTQVVNLDGTTTVTANYQDDGVMGTTLSQNQTSYVYDAYGSSSIFLEVYYA